MNINTTPRDDNRALAFIAAANYLKSTIPAGVRGSVDVHDYTFYNYECPVTHVERDEDGQPIACFAVTREGEIVTLIKKPGASMPSTELMQLAINNGGRWLYCLDTSVLRDLYTSMAFIRVACTPWDSALAPANWDADRYGKPCIAFYVDRDFLHEDAVRCPGKLMFPTWGAAKAFTFHCMEK